MAKYIVAAVRDAAIGAYNQPMFFRTVDEARRSFGDAVRNEGSEFFKHSDDFTMWMLGTWDDAGTLVAIDPDKLCSANDFLGPKKMSS